MLSQGFSNGQQGQLLVTTVALAIMNKGRRRPRMRYYRLLIILVIIQLFVGVTLTAVSLYATTVSPSLRLRDLPHWAGIPLSLSGLMGIFYITRCYGDLRVNPVSNVFKALSVTLASLSVILCACALAFMFVHLNTFSNFEDCKTVPYPASASIFQSFGDDVQHVNNEVTEDFDEDEEDSSARHPLATMSNLVSCTCFRDAGSELRRRYIYERIACDDVLALIKFLFIIMSMLTTVGTLDCALYVLLLWSFRYKDIYVGVRTGPDMDGSQVPS